MLARKNGIVLLKPIIRLRIIENLREITTNQAIVLTHFFKSGRPARSRACAARAHIGIFFLQSFFLCGYFAKEKSVNEILISIVSGTIFKHQISLAAFL